MWLIFALLSFFCYAGSDLFGKKSVNNGTPLAPVELSVSCFALAVTAGIAMYLLGVGESGMTPWQVLYHHPLILVNTLCFVLQCLLYLLSMKYLKLSLSEAVSGAAGIFYFAGLLLLNLLTGRLPTVREMLRPAKLIPVVLVLSLLFRYPRISAKKSAEADFCKHSRMYVVGISLLLASMLLDALDSLLTTLIIGEGSVGTWDYIMANYVSTVIPLFVFSLFIRMKTKVWYLPLKQADGAVIGHCIAALLSSLLYITASRFDAVRTGVLFVAYPVVPILGAKLFLKEKFTLRQNLCIWLIALSAIAFCVSDYVL